MLAICELRHDHARRVVAKAHNSVPELPAVRIVHQLGPGSGCHCGGSQTAYCRTSVEQDLHGARVSFREMEGQPSRHSMRSTNITRRVFTSSVGLVLGRCTSTA